MKSFSCTNCGAELLRVEESRFQFLSTCSGPYVYFSGSWGVAGRCSDCGANYNLRSVIEAQDLTDSQKPCILSA